MNGARVLVITVAAAAILAFAALAWCDAPATDGGKDVDDADEPPPIERFLPGRARAPPPGT